MKNKSALVIFIFGLVVMLAGLGIIFGHKTAKEPNLRINNDYSGCVKDTECISVNADSCGCTAGGTATAINSKFKTEWESKFPNVGCLTVMSNDPSCVGVKPKCIWNKCQLVKI